MPEKTIALNRRARHEFTIEDTFEAGHRPDRDRDQVDPGRARSTWPTPTRASSATRRGWSAPTSRRSSRPTATTTSPSAIRKLLLHRSEIDELLGKTKAKGLTLVPLRLYLDGKGRAKIELGLARGKQLHDRRRDIADRDARRDIARELADAQRGR